MYKSVLAILLGFSIAYANAQQTPLYSLSPNNPYVFNPAYAGLNYTLDLNLGIRSQYSGLAGAPKNQFVNAHSPIYALGIGAGLMMENESLGNFRRTAVSLSANKIIDRPQFLLSLGIRVGAANLSINGENLITPEGTYENMIPDHNDPLFNNINVGAWSPSWSLGSYLRTRYLDVGINVTKLPSYVVNIDDTPLELSTHWNVFFQGKYRWSDDLIIKPSMIAQINKAQLQTEVFLQFEHSGNIFGGLGLRGYSTSSIDALVLQVGTNVSSRLSFAYAYDVGLSSLKRVNEGTHEILINYRLDRLIGQGISPKIIYNPRYL